MKFYLGLQTHILELLQSQTPDAKFQGAICSCIIAKISEEIFVEHSIITNRLNQMLSETFHRKREIGMSELITHVYGTWSERNATQINFWLWSWPMSRVGGFSMRLNNK